MKIPRWFFIVLLISGILGFLFSLYRHAPPVTDSVITDMPFSKNAHYPVSFVKQLEGDPDAGRKIYKEFCASCHARQPIIDVHAPLIGDKKAWKIRKQKGMPSLLKKTIDGIGAMPARGGCFECSDEQLRETIQYILQ